LLPGIDALLAAIMFSSVLMPAGEFSCARILSSKNSPLLARNCCRKSYWLPGLPALRKWPAP